MKKMIFILLVSLLSGCVQMERNYPKVSKIFQAYTVDKPDNVGNTYPVSMVRLLSEADGYDGKLVSVGGVFSCKDNQVLLFMNDFSYRSFNITELIKLPSMQEDIRKKCADYAEGEAVTVFGLYRRPRENSDDYSVGRFEWVSHIGFSGFSFRSDW